MCQHHSKEEKKAKKVKAQNIWIDLAKSFNHKGTDADIEKLLGEMADELDTPYKSRHCRKFVVNLLKEKEIFEFVKTPDGTKLLNGLFDL